MASCRDCPCVSTSCRDSRDSRQEAKSHGQSLQEDIYRAQQSRQETRDRGQSLQEAKLTELVYILYRISSREVKSFFLSDFRVAEFNRTFFFVFFCLFFLSSLCHPNTACGPLTALQLKHQAETGLKSSYNLREKDLYEINRPSRKKFYVGL